VDRDEFVEVLPRQSPQDESLGLYDHAHEFVATRVWTISALIVSVE
jgi:hypothetical protein